MYTRGTIFYVIASPRTILTRTFHLRLDEYIHAVTDVNCAALFKKMDALRTKLRTERNNALAPLHRALKAMYHDVDPKKVDGLLADISAAFKVCLTHLLCVCSTSWYIQWLAWKSVHACCMYNCILDLHLPAYDHHHHQLC